MSIRQKVLVFLGPLPEPLAGEVAAHLHHTVGRERAVQRHPHVAVRAQQHLQLLVQQDGEHATVLARGRQSKVGLRFCRYRVFNSKTTLP